VTDLFQSPDVAEAESNNRPLADLLRPQNLDGVVGQDHLTGQGGALFRMAETGVVSSFILWGPPGCGKTTLARIVAQDAAKTGAKVHFEQLSAIFSGIGDLKKVFESARIRRTNGIKTILFVDEIHRFNKSQQDAFLPVMEDGTITLIGATTENPSFELNAAVLSRAQVLVLNRLDGDALDDLITRVQNHTGEDVPLDDGALSSLKAMADGDGRYFLSMIEQVYNNADGRVLTPEDLMTIVQRRAPLYDKGDDAHYNLISALHKSVRGSDVDGALYWFARMIAGGEDPEYIARRMMRMAVEDIGLADPQAIHQCNVSWDAYLKLGSPEGELALAQALIYLASAPKSNAAYVAYKQAISAAKQTGSLMPPKHILNAVTNLMKDINYGKDYVYDHDTPEGFSGQDYFPDEMERTEFYRPVERGFERDIKKRLDYWQKLRDKKSQP
jgi:putative ATPase